MNPGPFPFCDYERARDNLERALVHAGETYLLLTGETGTGKTALLHHLRHAVDRAHLRTLYFSHARKLGPSGLIRVLSRALRLSPARSHAETVQAMVRHFAEEPLRWTLWFDEAQELPDETLLEARCLAESVLGGARPLTIFFVGLPPLRERLQASPPLWRRIVVREEITGLTHDELSPFLEHHFDSAAVNRLSADALALLFERGRGIPGLILPMFRTLLREHDGDGALDTLVVEDTLGRWELV